MKARSGMSARRVISAAAAGASALALLGGCGMDTRQQAAVIVNGDVVAQDEVQAAAKQLSEYGFNEQGVVLALIAAPLLQAEVEKSGSWQPDATYATILARIPDATQATKDTLAAAALVQSAQMTDADVAGYRAALKAADISVNPRFGQVDLTDTAPLYFTLGAASPNWIAKSSK
ncbi:MAG: hypothetical protein ABIZ07_04740 [Dermatophilaceae bacterium]